MPTNVLLLRAPSEDAGGVDKYEEAFRTRGYRAISVPVLETVHTNIEQLKETVRRGGAGYAGVIVTSGRAVEAWRLVVQQLVEEGEHTEPTAKWSRTPFYVVGDTTAAALRAIPSSPYSPQNIRGAAESGTSEKLAHFIAADLSSSPSPSPSKKLFYLVGDKNRDTLPTIIKDAGLDLESLQVYATQGSSRFEEDLLNVLNRVQGLGKHLKLCSRATSTDPQADERWWIVYFAPSSAKYVSPILSRHFDIPLKDDATGNCSGTGSRGARLAAIGPTTASSLESDLELRIEVIAAKPTPESLANGIVSFDEQQTA
ncbi:tetrapyrrole biosynthesis uroporphyrinogen III synthase [Dichomitus squalens LYAD-421 SS1]|uniref:Tetrapyrrole biosynthesis uroporphyrinogen III synthase n=1 Tax=Dichomitus squalens (strain LYAD-421) TaxID=732165 RepID=R7SJ58_DICSQ|nr:tetrapyrrole biosynthesis uroporphyrinogen III synthase [Dichomitus squalens LYAD-421 SS1]EJF55923.1 tetrapyrrole biosynthesis uroporphyrinogen III synthase [Dichomitus squalens LYAD-421 SS1]